MTSKSLTSSGPVSMMGPLEQEDAMYYVLIFSQEKVSQPPGNNGWHAAGMYEIGGKGASKEEAMLDARKNSIAAGNTYTTDLEEYTWEGFLGEAGDSGCYVFVVQCDEPMIYNDETEEWVE